METDEEKRQRRKREYASIRQALQGNVDLMLQNIELTKSADYKNLDIWALHAATIGNHGQCVETALKFTKQVDCLTESGETALHIACKRNSNVICKLLLEHGADPNIRPKRNGETCLHIACKNNDALICKLLLDHGADPDIADKSYGETALHIACKTNDILICKLLFQHGADKNVRDKLNRTPLSVAVSQKQTSEQCVRLLLDVGVKVDSVAITNAVFYNNIDVLLKMSLECEFDILKLCRRNPFNGAVRSRRLELLEILLDFAKVHGEEMLINRPIYETGQTLLMTIPPNFGRSNRIDLRILQLLLRYGADANLLTADGRPALWFAMQHDEEYIEAVWQLTDLDKLKMLPNQGRILIEAIFKRRSSFVRRLLESGFNVNVTGVDCHYPNPLSTAVRVNDDYMFDILVNAGARFNMYEKAPHPLSMAIMHGNVNLVSKLIGMGFDLNYNLFQICLAAFSEAQWNILELFLKAGMKGFSESPLWPLEGEAKLCKFPPLVWKYMKRSEWNLLARDDVFREMSSFQQFVGKIQPLGHICRIAIRESLMLSGRSSVRKAYLGGLGLPKILQDYLMYS